MTTKRASGKKLIGAQVSQAIWDGVDEWLRRNPRKSVTDFVIEATLAKLDAEGVGYDRAGAVFDGRRRVPAGTAFVAPVLENRLWAMNEARPVETPPAKPGGAGEAAGAD